MKMLDDTPPALAVDEADLKRRGMVAAMRYKGLTDAPAGTEVLSCDGRIYVAVLVDGRSPLVYRVHKINDEGGHTLRVMTRPPKAVREALAGE